MGCGYWCIIMTLGHAAIFNEFMLYIGLALLVIGTGFFKPNMTSIISEMYKDLPERKDGAYTIFYGRKCWGFLWNDALWLFGRKNWLGLWLWLSRDIYVTRYLTILASKPLFGLVKFLPL